MSKGFDISSTKTVADREEEGRWVPLRDENDEPMTFDGKPVQVKVCGSYSKRYRKAIDAQRERMMKLRRVKLTGDIIEANAVELIIACVLGWEGFFANGKPWEFSADNLEAVLKQASWIRDQIEEAIQDHAGFTKESSSS